MRVNKPVPKFSMLIFLKANQKRQQGNVPGVEMFYILVWMVVMEYVVHNFQNSH